MEDIIKLRSKAKLLEPLIRIGKNGLTEGAVKEIRHMLTKKRMIKIKLLEAFTHGKDKKELAKDIVNKTNSIVIQHVGNMLSLHKK